MTIERHDTWYGWQPVTVQPFRTKRRGVLVTRYRLVAAQGGWFSPNSFISRRVAEHALWEASVRNPLFREVADAAHACESAATADGHGAYCKHCGDTLA